MIDKDRTRNSKYKRVTNTENTIIKIFTKLKSQNLLNFKSRNLLRSEKI